MKTTMIIMCTAVCLLPMAATAASQFDGTWRLDIENAKLPAKPIVLAVKDGIYTCNCTPPETVKADGMDHPVAGNPYRDTVAVTVVDAHTMHEVDKKSGKVVDDETRTLSADGKTLSFTGTSTSFANGLVTKSSGSAMRVAAGPAGSIPMSGSWHLAHVANLTPSGRLMTYKLNGDLLSYSDPSGISFTATVDGGAAPLHGDPGADMVMIKRLDATSLQETDTRAGKPVFIGTMSVKPAAKVMDVTFLRVLSGRKVQMKAYKE